MSNDQKLSHASRKGNNNLTLCANPKVFWVLGVLFLNHFIRITISKVRDIIIDSFKLRKMFSCRYPVDNKLTSYINKKKFVKRLCIQIEYPRCLGNWKARRFYIVPLPVGVQFFDSSHIPLGSRMIDNILTALKIAKEDIPIAELPNHVDMSTRMSTSKHKATISTIYNPASDKKLMKSILAEAATGAFESEKKRSQHDFAKYGGYTGISDL